jgi:hypothetical protein
VNAAALLGRLAALDSCACSDGLDRLGLAGAAPGSGRGNPFPG